MKVFKSFLLVAALLAAGATANAAWTDETSNWTGQGLSTNGGFMADTTNEVMYYAAGTNIWKYTKSTDTWTNLNATVGSGVSGYLASGGNADNYYYVPTIGASGGFVSSYQRPQLDIYDIATNSWYTAGIPNDTSTEEDDWGWGQGVTYDPVNDTVWLLYTHAGANEPVGYAYNPTTGIWGSYTVPDSNFPGQTKMWGRMGSTNIGNLNFGILDDGAWVGNTVKISVLDWNNVSGYPDEDTEGTITFTLPEGESLSSDSGSSFRTGLFAVYDGKLYLTGEDLSGVFLCYDPATDTWTELESFENGSGGYRDHQTAAADGIVFVRDGSEFFAYAIPEPATMALLAFGGIGLLIRRKK